MRIFILVVFYLFVVAVVVAAPRLTGALITSPAHSEVLTGKYNLLKIVGNNAVVSGINDLTPNECAKFKISLIDLDVDHKLFYSVECLELNYSEMNKIPGERVRARKE